MGHMRLGRLPETRTWQQVVDLIVDGADVKKVADATAQAAENALTTARNDEGFRHAVFLLIQIAVAAGKSNPKEIFWTLGVTISEDAQLADLGVALSDAMDCRLDETNSRSDFGEMAQGALINAVLEHFESRSPDLFSLNPIDMRTSVDRVHKKNEFGKLARLFFAYVSDEYVRYFLSKTLSTHIGEGRRFATTNQMAQFEDAMSTHYYEAAAIVEEFSADWFSKHKFDMGGKITRHSAGRFGWYAVERMREELAKRSKRNGP